MAARTEPSLARTRILGKVLRFFAIVHLAGAFALSCILIFGLLQVYYARGRFEVFDDAPTAPVILALLGASAGMLLTALLSRRPVPIAVSMLLHPIGYGLLYLSLGGDISRFTPIEDLSVPLAIVGLMALLAGDLRLLLADRITKTRIRTAEVSRTELADMLRDLIVDQSQGSAKALIGRLLYRLSVGWVGALWIPLALTFLVAQSTGLGEGGGTSALVLWGVFLLAFVAVSEPLGKWLMKQFPLADMPTDGGNEAVLAERLENGQGFGILLRAFEPNSTLDEDIRAIGGETFFAVEDARIGAGNVALRTVWIPWNDWQAIVHPLIDHASVVVFDLTNADRSSERLTGLRDELGYAKMRNHVEKTLVVTQGAAISRQDLRELVQGFVVHEQKPNVLRFLPGFDLDSERHKLRVSLDRIVHRSDLQPEA